MGLSIFLSIHLLLSISLSMNNHICSTLFKTQERKLDKSKKNRAKKAITQSKKHCCPSSVLLMAIHHQLCCGRSKKTPSPTLLLTDTTLLSFLAPFHSSFSFSLLLLNLSFLCFLCSIPFHLVISYFSLCV